MRRKFCFVSLIVIVISLGLSACSSTSDQFGPAPVQPGDGLAGIQGQVQDAFHQWPDEQLRIYAAPYSDPDGNGFYVLEPSVHPNAGLDSGGRFQLNDVKPGRYVLVVGPSPEEGKLIVDDQQELRIVSVQSGQVLDLGKIRLAP